MPLLVPYKAASESDLFGGAYPRLDEARRPGNAASGAIPVTSEIRQRQGDLGWGGLVESRAIPAGGAPWQNLKGGR